MPNTISWQLFQQQLTKLNFNQEKKVYEPAKENASIVINNRTSSAKYAFTPSGFKYQIVFDEIQLVTAAQQKELWSLLSTGILFGEHMLQQELAEEENAQLVLPGYSHGITYQQDQYKFIREKDKWEADTKTERLEVEFVDPLQFHLSQVMTSLVLGHKPKQQNTAKKVSFTELIQAVVAEFDDIEMVIDEGGPLDEERDIVFFQGRYTEEEGESGGELNFYQYLIALVREIGWHLFVDYEQLLVEPEFTKQAKGKYSEKINEEITFATRKSKKLTYKIVKENPKEVNKINENGLRFIKSFHCQPQTLPLYPPKVENTNSILVVDDSSDKISCRNFTSEVVNVAVQDQLDHTLKEAQAAYTGHKKSSIKVELQMSMLPIDFHMLLPGGVFKFDYKLLAEDEAAFPLLPENLQELRILTCDIQLSHDADNESQQTTVHKFGREQEDLKGFSLYQGNNQVLEDQKVVLWCEPSASNYCALPKSLYSIAENFTIEEGIVMAPKEGQYQFSADKTTGVPDKFARMNFYHSIEKRYTVKLPRFHDIEVPMAFLPAHNNMHWPLADGARVRVYLYATYGVIREVLSTNMEEFCTAEEQQTASMWGDKDRNYTMTTKNTEKSMAMTHRLEENVDGKKNKQEFSLESNEGMVLRVSQGG